VETGCRGVDEEGGGRSIYGVEASKEGNKRGERLVYRVRE